jgi:hypothetical protein
LALGLGDRIRRGIGAHGPLAAVTLIGLILSTRFFSFISHFSVNLLYWDQWDFLNMFFEGDPGIRELFLLQHGPPREGLGLIADKFLYPLTHWNVRAESFMIGGCIFIAMLIALLVKIRLFHRIAYSDVVIPVIFLTLAQSETLIGTPNPAYSAFPLLLIMLYCLALLAHSYAWKYGLLLLLNFLLIYTGFGVFIGVVTIGLFAPYCSWSWRDADSVPLTASLTGLVVAGISLGSFFIRYTFQPAVECFEFPYRDLMQYPWFMALMFATFGGMNSPLLLVTFLGALILLFVAFVLVTEMRIVSSSSAPFNPVHLIVPVLLTYSLLFSANTAVGRVCLGLPSAHASRYTTLLIPAFLAMYFFLLTLRRQQLRRSLVLVLLFLLIPGHVHISIRAHGFADGKRAWAQCYTQTEDIAYCDSLTKFPVYPDAERTRLKQKLEYLKKHRLNLFAGPPK